MLLISPSCLENRNFSRSFPFLSPSFTLSSEGVGNNEAKAELCVIYINDYIAVSHLFAWASMVVLWKSYIIPVPLPRQLRKKGAFMFSYIVKVLWPELCSSIQPFATNLSFLLHDRTIRAYTIWRHSATNQCKAESAVTKNTSSHPNMYSYITKSHST